MFTGLVETTASVTSLDWQDSGDCRIRLAVADDFAAAIETGDSVAVSGVCLTALPGDGTDIAFDVSHETLDCTTLGALVAGSRVNLERSLTLASRLGGHLVSGHVDGIGEVTSVLQDARSTRLEVRLPAELLRYVAPKGSLCVDGVSLTVNSVDGDRAGINLIPHTLEQTTLSALAAESKVNIEVDMIARYLERLIVDPHEPQPRSST